MIFAPKLHRFQLGYCAPENQTSQLFADDSNCVARRDASAAALGSVFAVAAI
jgi:hypothetical protein